MALIRAHATAAPNAMTIDPTYKGCRVSRYGPDCVTSRPFSRCPAAQMRNSSPNTAITAPAIKDRDVGRASHSTAPAQKNPNGTRTRASRAASTSDTRQPPVDELHRFARRDVQQTPPGDSALTLI